MDMVRDPQGSPPNNLYKALIIQAAIAGAVMILAFLFQGRMARSEAIAWKKEQQERFLVQGDESTFEKLAATPTILDNTLSSNDVTIKNGIDDGPHQYEITDTEKGNDNDISYHSHRL